MDGYHPTYQKVQMTHTYIPSDVHNWQRMCLLLFLTGSISRAGFIATKDMEECAFEIVEVILYVTVLE